MQNHDVVSQKLCNFGTANEYYMALGLFMQM